MLKKIQEKPEKFISNYRIMVNELGPKETERVIKLAISNMFLKPTQNQLTLFEKDCSKRKSAELEGNCILELRKLKYLFLDESESEEQESELDITLSELTTVTRSMDDSFQSENELLKEEIKKLKLKVERLEEEKKRVEPLVKLYERVKEVKNGSGQMIINPNLTRLNIVLERYYFYYQ